MTDLDPFDDPDFGEPGLLDAETWDCPRRLTLDELRAADGVDLRASPFAEDPEDFR